MIAMEILSSTKEDTLSEMRKVECGRTELLKTFLTEPSNLHPKKVSGSFGSTR